MIRLPRRTNPQGRDGLPSHRLNALTDGVFAFALTILALDLRLPDGIADEKLGAAIVALGPRFLGFLLTFGIIASAWVYVHQMSSIYTRTSLAHLGLSILALMFVAILPFATDTLGGYPSSIYGPLLYGATAFALVATYTVDFALCRRCVDPAVDPGLLRQLMAGHLLSTAILAAGCALSFLEPWLAVAAVGVHVAGHWTAIWWFEGDMLEAQAAIGRAGRARGRSKPAPARLAAE